MRSRLISIVALLALVAGCASRQGGGRGSAERLAVFEARTHKVRLLPRQRQALHDLAIRLFELTGAYRPVPFDELTKTLARRQKAAERRCRSFRCQRRLAPRLLNAERSLALTISERLLSQCEVTARLFDLPQRRIAYSARATASCNLEDLVRSLSQVICHISAARLTGQAAENRALPKRRRRRLPSAPPARQTTALCLARGQLAWLEAQLEAWARERIGRGEDPASAAERALDLRRRFERLAQQTPPQVAVPALCRVGTVYERLAERIARIDARAPAEARRRRAAPFHDQARKLYRRCVAQAEAKGVNDRTIELARARAR